MTDPLTPVLTANWDQPDSFTLDGYSRTGGYKALPKALAMAPDDVIAAVKGAGAARPRRRGLPDRHEVVLHPAERRQAALPGGQRGRVRAGHLQGRPADDGQPARADRGRHHHLLRDPGAATRSSTCAARCCTSIRRLQARGRGGVRGRVTSARTSSAPASTSTSSCTPARAPTSAARRRRCSTSLEGYRGLPRNRPPFPAVEGLYASPTVINNVESIASVPSIIAQRRRLVRRPRHARSPRASASSRSPGTSQIPGQYEAPLGITLRELLELAGGMLRPEHRLKFWTPGGSSTPLLTDEHLDVPLDFEGVARRRIDARHPGAADLRRDHLRGARRAPLDRVLPARVVRQVHAVPRGHVLDGADPRAAGGTARAPTRTSRSSSTSATTSSAARSARSATARRRRSPPRSSTSATSIIAAPEGRRLPVRPGRLDRVGGVTVTTDDRWQPTTGHGDRHHRRLSRSAVPKGTLVIRAAEMLGIAIPRFCDHPLLDPIGACRQCLVEVEGQRKPLASCTTVCTEGMVVKTQLTSAVAEKAQRGVMELLLINHPLDCPMCDKGGECPLQNQAMSNGQGETRFREDKRDLRQAGRRSPPRCCSTASGASPAPAAPGPPRRSPGDAFIEFLERGPSQYDRHRRRASRSTPTSPATPCRSARSARSPARAYRFQSRPFDLVSTPSVCEHCASGLPPAHRPPARPGAAPAGRRRAAGQRGVELRQGPLGVHLRHPARPAHHPAGPRRRRRAPSRRPGRTPCAVAAARPAPRPGTRRGEASGRRGVGVLTGGRLTLEDAYAYAKFARVALDTNDIDMRARPHSAEEEQFLAARVAGRGIEVSYADLEQAPAVLLAGFEPEDESPDRVPAAAQGGRARHARRCSRSRALATPRAGQAVRQLLPTVPGGEAARADRAGRGRRAAVDADDRAGRPACWPSRAR